jgi:hypothetical protein
LAIFCVLHHVGALVKESMDWSRMKNRIWVFGGVLVCARVRKGLPTMLLIREKMETFAQCQNPTNFVAA